MIHTRTIFAFLLFFTVSTPAINQDIKHIFVDINALMTTSSKEASKIVGIINSMKYTARMGHIPCKADFFKALKNVPSLSTQVTYNEDLAMPSIFSDWLLGLQSNNAVKNAIYQYLDKSSYSDIEKTIFKNVSAMMLNPTIFIETQYVIKDITKILHHLKKAGYTIYLIGNLDKESEQLVIKLLHAHGLPDVKYYYFSHKAKQLKPNTDYFQQLLQYFRVQKHECLIIDIERQHTQAARTHGLSTILLHGHNAAQLKSELVRAGIRI